MTYNPAVALLLFLAVSVLAFFLFRPTKGWYWLLKDRAKTDKKELIEDILKYMYHSQNEDKAVSVSDIARTLKDEDKYILETLKEMSEVDLISLAGNGVKLTEAGSDYALRMVRAHRLWERFLADKTGYEEADWHKLAEKKEHDLSLADTERLAKYLGNPQFDPHGDPIPSSSGKVASIQGDALSELNVDAVARIIHIKDKPDIVYKQIVAENIHIGSVIRIVEKSADRIVFHAEGEAFVLAPIVASNITVSVLKKEVVPEENIARLSMLQDEETAEIIGISREIRGESRRRLLDLGFVKGAEVKVDLPNPLGDPKAFLIKGTSIAIRQHQASKILIKKQA
ncbi:metal-dependent transcriptional regulator [Jiulongibacter sp. NS-SX5]|uniref:metal-dependent transcriptional regulator n=1 Tax=Jiulongibacter sp. NS-SX5 TaxID=3463854 RepID=UPI004058106A